MKTDDRKRSKLSLTLLLASVIFCFTTVTVIFAAVLGYFLVKTGIIAILDERVLSPYQTILLMTANSLVLGAIISATISKYPLRPVNMIMQQMNRLASGDFKARLDLGSTAEKIPAARELSNSFNKMAEELEATEMLRSDFINNFSHEFKTPIVSIAGFAKLLKRGKLTDEQKAEYIDIIAEESMRLSNMATNVLHLTKVENQGILTDISEYNLSEQIRGCILLLEEKWEKKNISFGILFGEHTINASEELLKHVWINLIDNAIKFSDTGGYIELDIKNCENTLSVSVKNNGADIPKEIQEKIFNKFYQADESHSAAGNGIGLALVKKISDLHKGKVYVKSENGETVFTVDLPKKQ